MPGKGGNHADTKKPDEVCRHLFGGCHMFFCGAAELWSAKYVRYHAGGAGSSCGTYDGAAAGFLP